MGKKSAEKTELVIVTGLSGAGKSRAVDALEDIGFFCVDNMPFTCGVVSAESDLIPLLRVAYNKAYKNIWELAESQGNDFKDYDTTLDVVIYNGNNIIYQFISPLM